MGADLTQYNMPKWMASIEERLKKTEQFTRSPVIPGLQILPNGQLFAQGGMAMGPGGGAIAEPPQVPVPTNVQAGWGSSVDVIYIDVSWDPPTGYGADQVVMYLVRVIKTGGGDLPIEVQTAGTSTRVQPVEPNTEYQIQVAAITRTGRISSVGTTTIETGGDTTPPAAPTFPASPVLEAVEALSIRWNANTERDVANGAGQYRVVVSTSADLSTPLYDARVGGTNVWVGGLTAGTSYYVGVYAIDSSGNQSTLATPPGGPWEPAPNVTDTSAIAFGGGNVVRNSGFEDYFPGQVAYDVHWTFFTDGTATMAKDTTVSHGGFGVGSAKSTGSGNGYLQQDLPLSVGTWIFSAWVKASSLAAVSGSPVGAAISLEAISGAVGNFTALLGTQSGSGPIVSGGLGTYDWKRIALKFDVTTTGNIRIYLARGSGAPVSGSAWFDEVQVENGEALTGYAPRPDEITSDTISSVMIASDQITAPKIAAGSIVAGKIAAEAVGTVELQAESVTAGKIQTNTITATQIAANAITASELNANAVTADKIDANAVTTAKLAADSVTAAKLAAVAIAVDKYIESASYTPNTSGWRIDGTGNAEFNNAQIRGTLHAARFGSDLFDFTRVGGEVGARFWFTGTEDRFYLGQGMVNSGQYIAYDNLDGQVRFTNGNWRFNNRTVFDSVTVAYDGYGCGYWGTGAGYFIAGNPGGTVYDTDWGVGFGTDGASAFTAMLQGYLDSTSRHVGLANMNGGIQQVYIDCSSSNPADTRSLTRTGFITYSDPKTKTKIRGLGKALGSAREKINAVEPIKYRMRSMAGKKQMRVSTRDHIGFSAEDIKAIVPEAVHENVCFVDPENATEDDVGLGLQMDALIPVLWQGHREQDEQITDIDDRLRKLEGIVNALEESL